MMISFIWALVFLLPPSDDTFGLDEIYAKSVKSAATLGHRTLFLGTDMDGPRPINKIFIYDFKADRVLEVMDGRIRPEYKMVVIAGDKGFVLVDYKNMKQISLDEKGAFTSSMGLDGVDGYSTALTVAAGVPIDSHRVLLTGLELPNTKETHMVILDLQKGSFETIFKNDTGSVGSFWFQNHENWCLVFPDTGRMDLFDTRFRQIRSLIPAGDPYLIVTNARVRELLREKGVSPNARLLSPPTNWIGDTCYFRKKVFSGKGEYTYLIGALQKGKLEWSEEGYLPLGEYESSQLVFNCNTGEFHRKKGNSFKD